MPASVTASSVRGYEASETGSTTLVFYYVKNDGNVKSILVELLDGSTVVASGIVDVSMQATGSQVSYSVTLNNNLSRVTVSGAVDKTITALAGGDTEYTPPSGYDGIVMLAGVPDAGVSVIDPNGVDLGKVSVFVPNGVTIKIRNTGSSDVLVPVTEIPSGKATSKAYTVRFSERDLSEAILYQYSVDVSDIPPIQLGYEGAVDIILIE